MTTLEIIKAMSGIATIIVKSKILFDEIKIRSNPLNYVECGNCGAIKVDTQEAVRALSTLCDTYKNEDDESQQSIRDSIGSLIGAMVEPEPEFNSIPDWDKWDEENEHRKCNVLNWCDYYSVVYEKYSEIVLRLDEKCNCFQNEISKR